MTPFVAFLVGTFGSGTVLALVFGALHLEAEEKAYQRGFKDGVNSSVDIKENGNYFE